MFHVKHPAAAGTYAILQNNPMYQKKSPLFYKGLVLTTFCSLVLRDSSVRDDTIKEQAPMNRRARSISISARAGIPPD
jgi:hypothetical protein